MITPLNDQVGAASHDRSRPVPVERDPHPPGADRRFAALLQQPARKLADRAFRATIAAADQQGQTASSAERFNEDGFFGRAIVEPGEVRTFGPLNVAAAHGKPGVEIAVSGTPADRRTGPTASPIATPTVGRAPGLIDLVASTTTHVRQAVSAALAPPAARVSMIVDGTDVEGEVSVERALPAQRVVRSAVSVQLRETPTGLEVIVTIPHAEDFDDAVLHDAIRQTLERHGRVAKSITIVERPACSDQHGGGREHASE